MGQRNGFSDGDVAKLNSMYKCPPIKNSKPATFKPHVPHTPVHAGASAGGHGGGTKYPVLNFIGNFVKPFLQEGSENNTITTENAINEI